MKECLQMIFNKVNKSVSVQHVSALPAAAKCLGLQPPPTNLRRVNDFRDVQTVYTACTLMYHQLVYLSFQGVFRWIA